MKESRTIHITNLDPSGIKACSRWLSAEIPPDYRSKNLRIPAGCHREGITHFRLTPFE